MVVSEQEGNVDKRKGGGGRSIECPKGKRQCIRGDGKARLSFILQERKEWPVTTGRIEEI
jgi:hypothetical protein